MNGLKNRLSKSRGAFVGIKRIQRSTDAKKKRAEAVGGCETWKMDGADDRAVDVFHNKCLRRMLQIQQQDHVSTEEPLERADMEPLSKEVKQRR